MKIFRSACKTRVLFQKGDNLFSKPLSEIGDVRLEDQFVVISDKSGNEISKSEVAVTEVPDYASGEDKVVSLINWLLCGDGCCETSCDDPCNERYYYDTINSTTEFSFAGIAGGNWATIPFSYILPDDLDCNAIFEVHLLYSFFVSVAAGNNAVIEFLLDGEPIPSTRSYATLGDAKDGNTITCSFAIEGDQSGKQLTCRIGNTANVTETVTSVSANLIVKRIR